MNKLLCGKKAAAVCFLILGLCAFFSCDIWDLSVPDYIENQLNRGKDRGSGGSDNPGGGGNDNPGGGNDNPGGGNDNPGGGNDNPGGGNDNPGGPDLSPSPGPHIIAAVPGDVPGDFTLYWYLEADPDFGEAVSMKVSSGSSSTGDIQKADWIGGGGFTAPYITEIQLPYVLNTATLTLTVSNTDGEKSFVIENPAELEEPLPVYVCEIPVSGDQGILPGSPADLGTAFDSDKILGRYSKIKVIVTESVNNAGNYSIESNKKVVIEPSETGGNVTINKDGQGSMFTVKSSASLTIQGKNGNTIEFKGLSSASGGSTNNDNPLFMVDRGNLIMNEGVSITGNNNTGDGKGGGVKVVAGGLFNMAGGKINGNFANNGGGVYIADGKFIMEKNAEIYNNGTVNNTKGGGVSVEYVDTEAQFIMKDNAKIYNNGTTYTEGGGVYVYSSGTFTMNGGSILENKGMIGGGVYITDGKFIMEGGEISGNINSESGGGVYIAGGEFAMKGGEILNNIVSANGGGVFINGNFEMTNGTIAHNNANSGGGGVYIEDGNVTMTSGEISENNALGGGGVFVQSGTFTIGSGSRISNNTALNGGGGVYLSGGTFEDEGGTVTGNDPDDIYPP